jgi:hypothetical protein
VGGEQAGRLVRVFEADCVCGKAIVLCLPAAWLVVRFAAGWSELDGAEVYDRSRFRHGEAYAKMAFYVLVMVVSLTRLLTGLEEAYSHHHHIMKLLGRRGRGAMF